MESKKVEFFNKLSFTILTFTLFMCLFFFLPYVPIALEASKGFLLSIGATLSLFFWLISRLGDGKFLIPKDKLLIFTMFIPLVFLISSFFSPSMYISLWGSGFEIGTFGSMLTLFIVFFLSSIYFQKEKNLWYFVGSLFVGGLILVLFELFNIFIGFDRILPGFLQGISSGNLVGSWNNFAVLIGMMVLLSLFTLELLKTRTLFRGAQYLLLILGIFFLIIVNVPLIWSLVGIFAVVIFIYSISVQHFGGKIIQNEGNKKKFPFTSLIVIFITLTSLVGSNLFGNIISNYININNSDIRPSIVATSKIAMKAIWHNPLLGTGPNTFVMDWALWQPKEVAETVFWNIDFVNGFSLLTTFIATTGLLGLISFLMFLVIYVVRGIQSIRIAMQNTLSNYFIMTTLMISMYSWITIVLYNPNIIILMLAFSSSGILIGVLVYKQAIMVKEFSFLHDPRNSFFSILGLVVLMISALSLTYIYIEKFTSIIYFSQSLNRGNNTIETLSNSEGKLLRAISLDKNDIYYRTLSQVYISKINVLINNKEISKEAVKSDLQQLINLAQEKAELAVKQNPKQYLNYMNLGNIYSVLVPLSVSNSYESAIIAYNKALELAPNNPSIFLARASLEFSKKNNSEARKFIKQAISLKTNYIDAIFLLIQIENSEGNIYEAIKQAEYGSEISPDNSNIFFTLGLLRYNNNDYRGAISAFERVILLDNNYLDAHYLLGQSYKKIGRISDALDQFNLLKMIIPDNQELKNAIDSINQSSQDNFNKEINIENFDNDDTLIKPILKKEKQ